MTQREKRIELVTEGISFKYDEPNDVVGLVRILYAEGSPGYGRIIQNLYIEGDTADNVLKIIEGIKTSFPQKRKWPGRAKRGVASKSGFFTAEFIHPLAIKSGTINPKTSEKQGNFVSRSIRPGVDVSFEFANLIIEELNEILSEPDYWFGDGLKVAKLKFKEETFNLFYEVDKRPGLVYQTSSV